MRKALQDAVPEGGQIQIVMGFFTNFTKLVFEKKSSQNQITLLHGQSGAAKSDPPGGGPDPDCLIKL